MEKSKQKTKVTPKKQKEQKKEKMLKCDSDLIFVHVEILVWITSRRDSLKAWTETKLKKDSGKLERIRRTF